MNPVRYRYVRTAVLQLMLLIDDDFVAGANIVAVQSLVGIFHLLEALQVAQILINVEQSHL